jgi:glucokinase
MRPVVGGIDLGGTGSRFVMCDAGAICATQVWTTAELGAGDNIARVARIEATLRDLMPPDTVLVGIGIGATGPVDRATGVVHNPDTLPWFSEMPLAGMVEARCGVPVVIDNDAVVAAFAEYEAGAGGRSDRMLMVTLGTGIGVALLEQGRPFRGPRGAHPEGGHIPILEGAGRCYCGADGCWEQLASRQALQAMLRPHLSAEIPDAGLISEAARLAESNPAIARCFSRYGYFLGRGLSALHALYMPEVTVIGGSVAPYLPLFFDDLRDALTRAPGFAVSVDLRVASLGDTSGALGAALMAGEAAARRAPR